MRFTSIIVTAAAASAAVIGRQDTPAASSKVIIGSSYMIAVADYDGKSFNIVKNDTQIGTNPSWMAFKEPNLLYAVDENSNDLRLFNLDTTTNELMAAANSTEGNRGVVSIDFNKDKTRLVGASYTNGTVDVWDISDASALKYMKNITLGGELGPNKERQTKSFAHQAILDPSGRYFAICDLGTDSVSIIDSQDDKFEVVSRNSVSRAGCGPRHGAWYPQNGGTPTAFVVACELTNTLEVFSVSTTNGSSLSLTHTSELSTYGAAFPPANATSAAAGEIIISADGKHAYVSNRVSGNATDSISHFKITQQAASGGSKCKPKTGGITLEFVDQISSGGLAPRMFSFSKDQKTLFSTNMGGTDAGVVALSRAEDTGSLTAMPIASIPIANFMVGTEAGAPTFIQQIV
ncbi:Lactonase, 7-bladed beta-propeller-domain-containing protein [Colletotrichum acutatum]|uniref:Lactonase, 7-bladed beta-propeller-domain-containing protein n=1 Tax=Glomerella acutata TaxID=27357 RepID=A0AAD8XFX4_GLOAC|nr:Lactonase, 7-bladed beta-propeller-domain-containing protein [Colletotrichum acutatum]KAK1726314.1 Lactonase, 7-bladed beta-propeller-domain-containing protein [Colletotrichum acutatum]